MPRLREKSITKWIIFLPAFAIFLTFSIILTIVITNQKAEYEKSVELARKEYVKNSKFQAKDRIDKLVDYINFNEQFVLNEAKQEAKNVVNLAFEIISDTYWRNQKYSKEYILHEIKSKLQDMHFFSDLSGYYFIFDMQGQCLMHGADTTWDGQNLSHISDEQGSKPISNMIALLQKQESGFLEWDWKNSKDTSFRKKLGYIQKFEPLGIFVGSARYEDEIIERLKKETQKLLLNTKYGELGYIFAYDYDGSTISHGDHSLVGKNRLDVVTDGQHIIQDIVNGGKASNDGFFMNYTASFHPEKNKDKGKISFIRAIPQFEWVIGTGAYLMEESKALEEQKILLKEKMKDTIYNTFLISLMIILLVMGIMFFISLKIRALLTRYENHLLVSNKQIREQKTVFETLYQKSADGIWLLKDNIFIDCNEAIVKMFGGLDKSQLINISPKDIAPEFQPDGESSHEKALQMSAKAIENGVHKFEWRARKIDGTLFWISVVVTTIAMRDSVIQHCSVRDITARKELEEENKKQKKLLMHQVEHDILTGLPNRNLLQDRLIQAIKKASRDQKVLAVMFVDIDKFKSINDTLGHDAGDMLLRTIATRMKETMRETDTVARLSGDEFIILIDSCKDASDIFIAIKKLVSAFGEPFIFGNESFKVTMSIGVSVYPHDGESASKLLKNADIAMYKAKMEGRNRYKFFDQEMNQETSEHLEIEKGLHKALKENELVLHYQPQINLQSEQIVGFEALIRWNHPSKGLILPSCFIYIAEESELIIEIGKWVIKEAMQQMKMWYDEGLNPGKVAINFAGKQLDSPKLDVYMIDSLKESGCKPEWIEMEIVERFIMKDTTKSITLLQRFRDMGIDISIDDFGTGYSSLAYLKQLPVTKLKIDQSFVRNLEESPQDRAIAKTIIELGRGLGLKVLAEGVETKAQREFIYQSGCELMQGFLFSKPISAQEARILLQNQNQML